MKSDRSGELLGCWRVEDWIGSGGMADVFRVRRIDGVVEQFAAAKVLKHADFDRMADEAAILQELRGGAIAHCLSSGRTGDGFPYLILELVQGVPITDHADQTGLGIHARVRLFLQACSAVEHAHRHEILHLDLKPANILVNKEGVVKVIDFGIARSLSTEGVTQRPALFSGPYASPEQLMPDAPLRCATDIYGLGAVLYELLCGHPPFSPRLAAGELERQIQEETPHRPSEALLCGRLVTTSTGALFRQEPQVVARMRQGAVGEVRRLLNGPLDRVCHFALRKDPVRRYATVAELRVDLACVLDSRRLVRARAWNWTSLFYQLFQRAPLEMAGVAALLSLGAMLATSHSMETRSVEAAHELRLRFDASLEDGWRDLKSWGGRMGPDAELRDAKRELNKALEITRPPAARTPRSMSDQITNEMRRMILRLTGRSPEDDLHDLRD